MLKINWMDGYGNYPNLLLEDSYDLETLEDCEFQHKDGLWWHIQKNGLVRYFAHNDNGANNGGYGGASFNFLYKGEPKTLIGPWSSRASYLNMFLPANQQVADITVDNGRSKYAIGILVSELQKLWNIDAYLIRALPKSQEKGPIVPSMNKDAVEKPSGSRQAENVEYEIFAEPVNGL